MAVGDATKWFTKQAGDPSTGFVSGGDAVSSVTQIYADMSANGSVTDPMLAVPKVDQARVGNLLTPNVATGTDTLGTTAGFAAQGVTFESSTDYAWQGTRSLKVTATASANRAAIGGSSSSGDIPVVAGQTYTFQAQVLSSVVGRTTDARIYWWTSAGNVAASTANVIGSIGPSSDTWKTFRVTGVAPADAAFASVMIFGQGWSAGEFRYEDAHGFWQGAGGLWAPPGVPIANLGTYTDESVGRRIFTWDTVNNRWQMTYGDTGWRSISLSGAGSTKFPNGQVWIRRVNNLVRARFYAGTATVTGAGITSLASLPTGFRLTSLDTRGPVGSTIFANSGLPSPHGYYATDANLIAACTSASPNTMQGEVSSETADTWPTSLPGTAVDTIPV